MEENTYIQGTTEKGDFMMINNKIIYRIYCFDAGKITFLVSSENLVCEVIL